MPKLRRLHHRRRRAATKARFEHSIRELIRALGVRATLRTVELACDMQAEEVFEWINPYIERFAREGRAN